MNMLLNEKINFKSLEENTFKEMMKLGRKIIQDELRIRHKLIKPKTPRHNGKIFHHTMKYFS